MINGILALHSSAHAVFRELLMIAHDFDEQDGAIGLKSFKGTLQNLPLEILYIDLDERDICKLKAVESAHRNLFDLLVSRKIAGSLILGILGAEVGDCIFIADGAMEGLYIGAGVKF